MVSGPDLLRDLPDPPVDLTDAELGRGRQRPDLPDQRRSERRAAKTPAAFMPAFTRSLTSEDSSSAMAATVVNMARPMGLAVSIWFRTLMKRTPRWALTA